MPIPDTTIRDDRDRPHAAIPTAPSRARLVSPGSPREPRSALTAAAFMSLERVG